MADQENMEVSTSPIEEKKDALSVEIAKNIDEETTSKETPTTNEQDEKDSEPKEKQGASEGDSACLLYTSPSPRDGLLSRMPSSA